MVLATRSTSQIPNAAAPSASFILSALIAEACSSDRLFLGDVDDRPDHSGHPSCRELCSRLAPPPAHARHPARPAELYLRILPRVQVEWRITSAAIARVVRMDRLNPSPSGTRSPLPLSPLSTAAPFRESHQVWFATSNSQTPKPAASSATRNRSAFSLSFFSAVSRSMALTGEVGAGLHYRQFSAIWEGRPLMIHGKRPQKPCGSYRESARSNTREVRN